MVSPRVEREQEAHLQASAGVGRATRGRARLLAVHGFWFMALNRVDVPVSEYGYA